MPHNQLADPPAKRTEAEPEPEPPVSTDTHTESPESTQPTPAGRRGFLKTAAATGALSLMGMTAIGEASAAEYNTITVFGRGDGHHTYQIYVKGNIDFGSGTESKNDRIMNFDGPYQAAIGNIYGRNTDSYRFQGDIYLFKARGEVDFRYFSKP